MKRESLVTSEIEACSSTDAGKYHGVVMEAMEDEILGTRWIWLNPVVSDGHVDGDDADGSQEAK